MRSRKKGSLELSGHFAIPYFVLFEIFNFALLPEGLLYTTILCPLLFLFLYRLKRLKTLLFLVVLIFPFVLAHFFLNDLRLLDYFQSSFLMISVYIAVLTAVTLLRIHKDPARIFATIILLTVCFTGLAIILKAAGVGTLLWSEGTVTKGAEITTRLRLLTYEPSFLATLLVPFMGYGIGVLALKRNFYNVLLFLGALTPFMLSGSMGVISTFIFSVCLTTIIFARKVFSSPLTILSGLVACSLAIGVLSTENPVSYRIGNVIDGSDSSGRNRTLESPIVAYKIADSTSLYFGAGLGQPKHLAAYFFDEFWPGLDRTRLTNSVADTLATFGILGVCIRLTIEMVLFFSTKVHRSFFRTLLFFHAFFYQFTGSFLTNVAEYFIWALAFTPVFALGSYRLRWVFDYNLRQERTTNK